MTSGFNLQLLVTFSDIFDEEPKDLKTYLTGIERSDILNLGTFLLGFKTLDSKYINYEILMREFFCDANKEFAEKVILKLKKLQYKENIDLNIINHYTILQLFEFCFDNIKDKFSQTEAETQINIFKSILLLNERINEKQNITEDFRENKDNLLSLARLSVTLSFPYSDIINYDKKEILATQFIKSIFFFEFLESNSESNALLIEFLNHFKTLDWKSYLRTLSNIALAVIKNPNEGHTNIAISKDENFESTCNFLENLIVNDTDIIKDYDFIKIRSKPFYKLNDGVYGIIYGLFVLELIHKGVFFKILEIHKKNKCEYKIKNFRSYYCFEFSEKYLLYKLLKSIYCNRYIKYTGEQIANMGIEAEPDYYIRNGKNIFLFESKDIFIGASIKSSFDYELYELELKKKLYFEDNKREKNNKAVLQLINNTNRILTKYFHFDTNYKTNLINIYPILILHDHQFNLAGFNVIVNSWFQLELEKLKENGIFIDNVKPLVIIDIDTLILHQDLFRERKLKLKDILDYYFKFININKKSKNLDVGNLKRFSERELISFPLYISKYVNEKKIRCVPKMLTEKGITLFSD